MELNAIRKGVLRVFNLNGFSIQADAAAFLSENLLPLVPVARDKWVKKIVNKIQELHLDTIAVEKKHIELCIEECTAKHPSAETVLNVINCLELPRIEFSFERSKFVKDIVYKPSLFPPAAAKSQMFQRRYALILQRLRRNNMFVKKLGEITKKVYQLRTADYFLSSSEKIKNAVMFGLLVLNPDGQYDLEDATGCVRLNLSQCTFQVGLFTEQCFVIAEGFYDDSMFHAYGIGLPPAEPAKESRLYGGNLNFFGGPSETPLSTSVALNTILQTGDGPPVMVFLAEVWLDDVQVIEKLKTMFSSFSGSPPMAFVLMGNFLSLQPGPDYAKRLKSAFRALGEMIEGYKPICEKSNFILIPGPSDPGSPLIFPRSPLPNFITEDLKGKVPKLWLTTNPCRIQYCTREIMIIREDLLTKLCRNVIHFPRKHSINDIQRQYARTVACQSSLVPLPLHVSPVYSEFSHGLDLYPLPDWVVIGDQFQPFSGTEYMDCRFSNTGYFPRSDFSFQFYHPKDNTMTCSNVTTVPTVS